MLTSAWIMCSSSPKLMFLLGPKTELIPSRTHLQAYMPLSLHSVSTMHCVRRL